MLTEGTVNHLQVCPVLGLNSAPHDAVRDVLSHLVVQNGVTDAAVVKTRLAAADVRTYDADVVYLDPSSRARVILEVSIVTIGSAPHSVGARELDWMGQCAAEGARGGETQP